MDDCFWRSMTTDEIAAGGSKTAIVRKSAASQGKEAARGKGKEAAESESEEHAEGGKEVDIGAHVVDHGADTTMNELAQCSLMTPPEAAVKKRQSKSRTSTVDMFETPATCTRPSSSSGVTGAQGEEEGQGRSQKAGVEQGVRGGRGKGMKRAREPRGKALAETLRLKGGRWQRHCASLVCPIWSRCERESVVYWYSI
jgi:hypothetical protein